jgi:hypothetical protein
MTCKEYQQGEKMLRSWAEQMDQNQQNAQKCPRCKVSLFKSKQFSSIRNIFRFIYLVMVVVHIWFVQNVNVIFVIIVVEED